MSKQYDDTDKGSLFRNEKKETDRHPDYTGSINVGGSDYWLSAWKNTAKSGQTYLRLTVRPKDEFAPTSTRKPQSDDF